jgi:hypothetical protein
MHEGIIMKDENKTTKQTLTDNQEGFAVSFVMNGGDASAAYRENYSHENMKDATIWRRAFEVRHNSKVSARIHELRMMKMSSQIITIEERKKLLSERALDGDNKALDMLNKMEGVYVEKQEVTLAGHITMLPPKDKDN